MKILTAAQIREADKATTENEGIDSFQLMQRAANACTESIREICDEEMPVYVICGTGNNGGDGLCIAESLFRSGYNVTVHIIAATAGASAEYQKAFESAQHTAGLMIHDGLPVAHSVSGSVIVDALFGTGFRCPLAGPARAAVEWINNSDATVISIDMPSGMPTDLLEGCRADEIVKAAHTLTFQQYKLPMLLPAYGESTGFVHILDIGLEAAYIHNAVSPYAAVTHEVAAAFHLPRKRFAHKGNFGHALLVAGSKGMAGAAVLATRACLRSGAGLTTVYTPACALLPLQINAPEAIVMTGKDDALITELHLDNKYKAIGIGPGLGTAHETAAALASFIRSLQLHDEGIPGLVIDADGLNMLAANPELIALLPFHTILTPHPGEFRRLAGDWQNDKEMLEKAMLFASKAGIILVLKGHRTLITDGRQAWFNTTGNSGMAKGGSGDVLTGLITGLLASGYNPLHAAIYGVWCHGVAGDLAAAHFGMMSMTAGDIVNALGKIDW